ncbi:MAG: polysaccharide pyruvyl transferase family protein [Akkermansiaceae bacterium]|jgi:hypothetical protein|nr:polysaccharide pyruvyl transferase family protein [Akkermansiaceae bacterium]
MSEQNKVGIVTFHANYNFGAALQCASLVVAIQNLGFTVEVINFLPKKTTNKWYRGWGFRKYGVKRALKKKLTDIRFGGKTVENFQRFQKRYFDITKPCHSLEDVSVIEDQFSYVVAGSDQVWRFDRSAAYFLSWSDSFTGTRVSYAPCCTSLEQPSFQSKNVRKWIDKVDCLSVRNDFSREAVKALTGRDAEVVADPTLLVDLELEGELPESVPSEYILLYTLGGQIAGGNKQVLEKARIHHPGIPVVAICATVEHFTEHPYADIILHGMGPSEWVKLISNARFFITDSFHGVIFSIKYSTPFLGYYLEEIRAPRLIDLKTRYNLRERIVRNLSEFPDENFVECIREEPLDLIRAHRKKSLEFLTHSLSK